MGFPDVVRDVSSLLSITSILWEKTSRFAPTLGGRRTTRAGLSFALAELASWSYGQSSGRA